MNFNVTLRCLSGDWIFSQVMAVFSAAAGRGFNVSESSWGEHAGVAPNITKSFLHLKFTGYFTTIGLLFFVSCFFMFHLFILSRRVMELLMQDWSFSAKVRLPAISRLQKVHNVDVALQVLKSKGIDLKDDSGNYCVFLFFF